MEHLWNISDMHHHGKAAKGAASYSQWELSDKWDSQTY